MHSIPGVPPGDHPLKYPKPEKDWSWRKHSGKVFSVRDSLVSNWKELREPYLKGTPHSSCHSFLPFCPPRVLTPLFLFPLSPPYCSFPLFLFLFTSSASLISPLFPHHFSEPLFTQWDCEQREQRVVEAPSCPHTLSCLQHYHLSGSFVSSEVMGQCRSLSTFPVILIYL